MGGGMYLSASMGMCMRSLSLTLSLSRARFLRPERCRNPGPRKRITHFYFYILCGGTILNCLTGSGWPGLRSSSWFGN